MRSVRRYLESKPIDEALHTWIGSVDIECNTETVSVTESAGRVLSREVFSVLSSPHYHAAAMDGIAVKAEHTFSATETRPVTLCAAEHFVWVDTGDPLPPDTDAVIMSEDVNWLNDTHVEIVEAASPWQHVRPIGEDMVATELLFAKGHIIRPVDIGALLAAGIPEVGVAAKPVVALIPTGNEIVDIERGLPAEGEIIESNTYVQKALVESWGATVVRYPIVRDDTQDLVTALKDALERADIVAVNAGSSAGSEDYTADVIRSLGEVLVHGVAQRPGKPVILGRVRVGGVWKPVIGVPGYPVSSYLTVETFMKPLVRRMLGLGPDIPACIDATLTRKVASVAGVEEFLRVKMGRVGSKLIASPISRGAGVITSLVRADGIVRVPRLSEGLAEGARVNVQLMRPREQIENTVVVIGSHDPGLDLLGAMMHASTGVGLSSSHTGSIGGLLALRRGEAHAAGIHLVDESTGEYNTSYVQKMLADKRVLLVTLAERQQGLMVCPKNPRRISGVQDLAGGRLRIVNRQRGAGTRILLDLMLKKYGIDAADVAGYEHEEYTHTAVAAQVKSGVADCGMGVLAAARALGLDFIPITLERYELAILDEFVADSRVDSMLNTLRSREFAEQLVRLGGYDTSRTAEERWCGDA